MIVEEGGIDLQVLGIGSDGHIAFNEPGSSLGSRTRLKTLTHETIRDNARFFGSEEAVPRLAVTMGVGTILESRQCLLLAAGAHKAKAIRETIEGPITAQVTASALQLHRDVIAILDEEAARLLETPRLLPGSRARSGRAQGWRARSPGRRSVSSRSENGGAHHCGFASLAFAASVFSPSDLLASTAGDSLASSANCSSKNE